MTVKNNWPPQKIIKKILVPLIPLSSTWGWMGKGWSPFLIYLLCPVRNADPTNNKIVFDDWGLTPPKIRQLHGNLYILSLLCYQCNHASIIVRQHDQGASIVYCLKSWYIGHLKFVYCILLHEMCILVYYLNWNLYTVFCEFWRC